MRWYRVGAKWWGHPGGRARPSVSLALDILEGAVRGSLEGVQGMLGGEEASVEHDEGDGFHVGGEWWGRPGGWPRP